MTNMVIVKDGTNTPVLMDWDEPFHLNKNRAQTKCGKIITPTMRTNWTYQPTITDKTCFDCEDADLMAEDEADRITKEAWERGEIQVRESDRQTFDREIRDVFIEPQESPESSMMVWVSPHGAKYHRVLHKGMTGEQMPLREAHGLTVVRDDKTVTLGPCKTKPCFPYGVELDE